MSKKLTRLLYYCIFSSVIQMFVFLFVNLYIWDINKRLIDLTWFNLSQFAVWGFAVLFTGYLLYNFSLRIVLNISAFFFFLLFVLLSFVRFENLTHWIIFAGSLFGVARGIYKAGETQALSILGKGKEYTVFFQKKEFWSRVVNIITPFVFAGMIFIFGYRLMFIGMLLLSVFLFFLSFGVENIRLKKYLNGDGFLKQIRLKKLFKPKKFRMLQASYLTGGLFSEFQTIFLLFFTFSITSNEIYVALLNTFYTFLTFLSIKMYMRIDLEDESWLAVGIFIVFIGLMMVPFLNNWWLIIPNILLVFGNFYYRTIFYSQQFKVIADEPIKSKFPITLYREVFLSISRVSLLILIVILDSFIRNENYIFWVMAFAIIVSSFVPVIHRQFGLKKDS